MKLIFNLTLIVCAFLCGSQSFAQNVSPVDSSLVGRDVFRMISDTPGGSAAISQSEQVKSAFTRQINANGNRKLQGYRVRIYFDNSQDARSRSEYIARSFEENYPDIAVYRNHVSPYFKVTVGDFRTKAEAQRFADSISGQYPSVFLVKEPINYPDV